MIYLDNAASTKPFKEVQEIMCYVMENVYANPSALHKQGFLAENLLKESSMFFAKQLGCSKEEIIYTSGGTESNNLAILGAINAYKRNGNKIITSNIEHSSVKEVFTYLEQQGFEVIRLKADLDGYVSLEELENHLDGKTIFVSIMHINNEIGTIQPIEKIAELIKRKNKDTIFHVDAVQSFGKILVPKKNIDLISISGHKLYGPKGVGILYKNKNIRIVNLFYGGGQQKNIRSGTENVYNIVGMHKAGEIVFDNLNKYKEHYQKCKNYLQKNIENHISGIRVNSAVDGAPHILNISFKDIRSEILMNVLEKNDIYVSAGSACLTHKKSKNILSFIGVSEDYVYSAIRFSFSYETTIEDLDKVVNVLIKEIPKIRKVNNGGK
ncbi:cysteine desulfurase [Candidatus Epulonipiscium fishelsonii]|uniref:Cysteine desulfurase n=1 Tax=Candidatus Epulonipiscium fishelsonii TaxID=77094 RepID=A0ACC8XIG0_9FIRM|nr:cysteine desulfurase [Epulopiscium sp. SCG-D08WGA-EpuloA1]